MPFIKSQLKPNPTQSKHTLSHLYLCYVRLRAAALRRDYFAKAAKNGLGLSVVASDFTQPPSPTLTSVHIRRGKHNECRLVVLHLWLGVYEREPSLRPTTLDSPKHIFLSLSLSLFCYRRHWTHTKYIRFTHICLSSIIDLRPNYEADSGEGWCVPA